MFSALGLHKRCGSDERCDACGLPCLRLKRFDHINICIVFIIEMLLACRVFEVLESIRLCEFRADRCLGQFAALIH